MDRKEIFFGVLPTAAISATEQNFHAVVLLIDSAI